MENGKPIIVTERLSVLDLKLLQADNAQERSKLLEACCGYGVFYLDLRSSPDLCKMWDSLLSTMQHYFKQSPDFKKQDARDSDNFGYEGIGREAGPQAGTVDGYESLKVSRQEYLKKSINLTTSTEDQTKLFFDFIEHAHNITLLILTRLSTELGLTGAARFESFHGDASPNHSTLGMLHYPKHASKIPPKSVGHNMHTDLGSLTFLLTRQWGLQLFAPDTQRWEFVEPRPGFAIINIGDSLHFPSRGKLTSILHRVIPLGEIQEEDRYSIAYFLRMNDDMSFEDASGQPWTAKAWHDFKFNVFRDPKTLDADSRALTGGIMNSGMVMGQANMVKV